MNFENAFLGPRSIQVFKCVTWGPKLLWPALTAYVDCHVRSNVAVGRHAGSAGSPPSPWRPLLRWRWRWAGGATSGRRGATGAWPWANIRVHDLELTQDDDKADAFFHHFNAILGEPGRRESSLDFSALHLPHLGESHLDFCFSEEEIWQTILSIPTDKAPGPDGFTGAFYRSAWPIIKHDILRAFQALWALDGRSLYLVNQA